MQEIPLQQYPAQELQVILDGQECTIKIYWRFGRLFCDLWVGETQITGGAVCMNGASIVQVTNSNFSGSLHFFDLLGDLPPQWNGLGARWVLTYLAEGEEVPAALRY